MIVDKTDLSFSQLCHGQSDSNNDYIKYSLNFLKMIRI